MRASVLSSGSGGNCVFVEAGSRSLLVDCGLSLPELRRRLDSVGRTTDDLCGVLITHDHGDHVGSSVAIARRLGVPVYATLGTHSVLRRLPAELARVVRAEEAFEAGGFDVLPIRTPHDGIESVAFRVTCRESGASLGVVTDLGYLPRLLVERLRGVNALVVEHNHDERMLLDGPYPRALKERVHSMRGHLSNDQGAQLASLLMHDGLRQVVLAHLSETNNTPDLARRAFERANQAAPASLRLHVALQKQALPPFDV